MAAWGACAWLLSLWLSLYSLYDHHKADAAPPEALFPHTAAPKSIGQSAVLPLPRKPPHQQNMRPVACMSCAAPACVPMPTACPGTTTAKATRVRLIPHLSSPLLEPPVKVGSQGVLAIQLTAIGTYALQAVGPQDWPNGPIHHLLLNLWPPFSHGQRPTSTPRPNKLALLASPFSPFW